MKRIIFISIILCFTISIFAEPLKVAFGMDKPPYIWVEKEKFHGIEYDIAAEILIMKGYKFNAISMPNTRKDTAIKDEFDIVVQVKLEEGTIYFYSDPFIYYQNIAISKKSAKLKIETISDLTKYSVIAFQNAPYWLGGEFQKLFGPDANGEYKKKYSEQPKQSLQNKMFWAGRSQVVVLDKNIFEWYRKQLSGEFNTKEEVAYHDIFKKKTIYYAVFKDKKVRDDFNDGLAKMIKSGRYQQIIDSYIK